MRRIARWMRETEAIAKTRDPEQGSNVVEMALVTFLLLLLIAGIADFGRAFNSYIVITNAAREGARFASRVEHTEEIDSYIENAVVDEAANSGLDLSDWATSDASEIIIEPAWDDRDMGSPITVTVEYSMSTIFTGLVGLDTIPMRSQSTMVMNGETVIEPN